MDGTSPAAPRASLVDRLLDWRTVLALGIVAMLPVPALLFAAGEDGPPPVGVGVGMPLALVTLVAGVLMLRERPRNAVGLTFTAWSLGLVLLGALIAMGADGAQPAGALLVFFGLFPALVLALHPEGRMPDRASRALFVPLAAMVVVAGAGVIAAAPVIPGGAVARFCQLTTCTNTLALTEDPALTAPATRVFLVLSMAVLAVAGWAACRHVTRVPPDERRSLLPVAAAGLAWAVVAAASAGVQAVTVFAGDIAWIQPVQTVLAALIPLGAIAGVAIRSRERADSLPRLLRAIDRASDPADAASGLAHALRDPRLVLLAEPPAAPPPPDVTGLAVCSPDGTLMGELRLDAAVYAAHAGDVRAILPALAMAIERDGLAQRIAGLDRDLGELRDQAAASREDERQAIARDLHDGVQQQLIALRFRLGALDSLLARDPEAARHALGDIAGEAELALAAIRDLGRGAGPAGLAELGLARALRAEAARLPVEVDIQVRGATALSPGIERSAYFICLEGLQNALKHGGPGGTVTIAVDADEHLMCFRIRSAGPGATAIRTGPVAVPRTIAQRVQAMDGDATAAVDDDGFHLVEGSLPITGSSAGAVERRGIRA